MFLNKLILIALLFLVNEFTFAQNGKVNHLSNEFPASEEDNNQKNQEGEEDTPIFIDSTIVADDTLVFDDDDFDDKSKPRKLANIVQNDNEDNNFSNNDPTYNVNENIQMAGMEYLLDKEENESPIIRELKSDFSQTKITLYPNPVVNQLFITQHQDIDDIVIINFRGQQCDVQMINNSIDVTHLSEGLHFVKIRVRENIETHKIVVKK
jgi:hypothetical protein